MASPEAPQFSVVRWREGYDISDVDAFIAQVSAGTVTSEDARKVRFSPTRLRPGYDMGEVDEFLDSIANPSRVPGRHVGVKPPGARQRGLSAPPRPEQLFPVVLPAGVVAGVTWALDTHTAAGRAVGWPFALLALVATASFYLRYQTPNSEAPNRPAVESAGPMWMRSAWIPLTAIGIAVVGLAAALGVDRPFLKTHLGPFFGLVAFGTATLLWFVREGYWDWKHTGSVDTSRGVLRSRWSVYPFLAFFSAFGTLLIVTGAATLFVGS